MKSSSSPTSTVNMKLTAYLFVAGALLAGAISRPTRCESEQVSNSTQASSEQAQPTAANNETGLVEALNERLVKQSNLQAEESQPTLSVLVPPPARAVSVQPSERRKEQPVSFSGGSGNSYMSISRDGSNRYQFGFDTDKSQTNQTSGRRSPRLMREESRLEDGTVIGRYGYTDPFNVFRVVQYVAGPDGYFATEDVGAMEEGKLQLNRQLHRALEHARAQRRAQEAARSARSRQSKPESKPEAEVDTELTASETRHQEPLEPLSGSSSQETVSFATQINHVIGANGLSYATAFRPIVNADRLLGRSDETHPPAYEPVRSPDPLAAIQSRQQQQQQQLDLRSKLPAPIYTPSSLEGGWPTATADVLQASPAWSLLSNNYETAYQPQQQSALIVEHSAPGQAYLGPVTSQLERNFDHEVAVLRSLRDRSPAPPTSPPSISAATFGARTEQLPVGFNFGLALKQFDPPLYRPEVHETKPMATNTEPVVYSSTLIRSEVAAERDYRAERLHSRPQEAQPSVPDTVLRSQSSDLDGNGRAGYSAAHREPDQAASQSAPVRYATRLSGLNMANSAALREEEDMQPDHSERVSYLTAANGTSLAKLPDRSKKLSSMFKARTLSSQSDEGSTSKIRRPIPVNMKPKADKRDQIVQSSSTSRSEPSEVAPAESASKPDLQSVQDEAKPAKQPTVGKRPVTGSNGIEKQPVNSEPLLVSANQRPTLREPAASSTSLSAPMPTTSLPPEATVGSAPASPVLMGSSGLPAATIIGVSASDGDMAGLKSSIDKGLYEKIVKIQQEIAMSAVSSSPTSSREPTSTVASATPTTSTPSQVDMQPTRSTVRDSPSAAPAEQFKDDKKFLTGPLVAMDSSMELLERLSQDIDSFESGRTGPVEPATSTARPQQEPTFQSNTPLASFTSTTPLPLPAPIEASSTLTAINSSSSMTPTTVPPSLPSNTTTSTSKRPSASPRIGRLVIKRGDKVVARFNASEPIPDSMIPIGGNGTEIIMPDMPRLGMRKVKKKIQQKQMDRAAAKRSPMPVSSAGNDSTALIEPMQAEASDFRPVRAKSLSRGARSYAADEPVREVEPEADRQTNRTAGETTLRPLPVANRLAASGRNWSVRLRDSVSRQKLSDKRYDANEDLKKLVEKISSIERVGLRRDRPSVAERSARAVPIVIANSSQPLAVNVTSKDAAVGMTEVSSPPTEVSSTPRQPVNTAAESSLQPRPSSDGPTASKVAPGVNSHGHIQVRNNQSTSVHVDIEPPRRVAAKRLISRDTSARARDIERAPARPEQPDVNRPASERRQLEESSVGRRPQMLCIEVRPDSEPAAKRQ